MSREEQMAEWVARRFDQLLDAKDDWRVNCPFCPNADQKAHLYIGKNIQAVHCFHCEWTGSWIGLIMSMDNCTYEQAAAILHGGKTVRDFVKMHRRKREEAEKKATVKEPERQVPDRFELLDKQGTGTVQKMAIRYLKYRKIPDEWIYSGMFGVISDEMRVYMLASSRYWQARALTKQKPKYVNPGIRVGDTLGIWDSPSMDFVREMGGPIYICEGMFSALAVVRRGYPALALLGKRANPEQAKRLVECDRDCVLALDADAHVQAWELGMHLYHKGKTNLSILLLKEGDPDTCWEYDQYPVSWSSYSKWRLQYGDA